MQIKLLFRLVLLVLPVAAFGQSSYIRTGSGDYRLADRLEIKTRLPLLTQSFTRPYLRENIFVALDTILKTPALSNRLTAADIFHAKQVLDDPGYNTAAGNHTCWKADGFLAKSDQGYFVFNPVIRLQGSKEKSYGDAPFIASLGFDARGTIFHRIGFDLYATANRERLPAYLFSWRSRYNVVPGAGNATANTDGTFNYWDVRGSVYTPVTKYIDIRVGYDRNFLGNGYRSLFLSDFSNSTAFARIGARIWRLNFQSLYMKLTPQPGIVNEAGTKKYLRLNTLGIDVAKWLNISFFDAVVLGRKKGIDLNYILPLTFLRAMEHQSGSPDNALFGMNVKMDLAGRWQLYGQVVLDEFKLSELKAQSGWWANKYGYQAGVKYIDALGIKNLDLQVETNRVRPFTYTHFDSVSNYTHYGQPLAHPLGASFHEYIGILHYRPFNRLSLEVKAIYYKQGLDSLGYHTGNNILINYNARPRDYGWEVGSGNKATCMYLSAMASFEAARNLFIDLAWLKRKFTTMLPGDVNTTMISAGIRWNIGRREFDF